MDIVKILSDLYTVDLAQIIHQALTYTKNTSSWSRALQFKLMCLQSSAPQLCCSWPMARTDAHFKCHRHQKFEVCLTTGVTIDQGLGSRDSKLQHDAYKA